MQSDFEDKNSMLAKFVSHNQDLADKKTLLAVSAGLDSVVMAHLFARAGYYFGIVHCHFSLRDEAEAEVLFVEQLAKGLGVAFYFRKFDTQSYAREQGISTQMAARALRYAFFEEIRQHDEAWQCIATAHHLDDNLETVLFNFVKGTGIRGMRGIPSKNGFLIRPLLFATRPEIQKFAEEHQIRWIEDTSNASDKYSRNFIRHQIVPKLKELNPNLLETFASTLKRMQSVEKVFKEYIEILTKKFVREEGSVVYIGYGEQWDSTLLYEIIQTKGFSFGQCEQIIQKKLSIGADFFSQTHWLVADRNAWVITPIGYKQNLPTPYSIAVPGLLHCEHFSMQLNIIAVEEILLGAENMWYADYEAISGPLQVRSWVAGERMKPLGMAGTKKISDILIDAKIPKNLKKRILVLATDKAIVCLLGLRTNERFKVTKHTLKVLKIEYKDRTHSN